MNQEIQKVNIHMSRDAKLYELRMRVLGYMQIEDKYKASEAFEQWKAALREVE